MPKSSNKRQEKLHISIKKKVKLKCLKFINTDYYLKPYTTATFVNEIQ